MKKDEYGRCKLTGNYGRFVKSHILPKALTPKELPGGLMFQSDGLDRPIKRRDSWYDSNLVIRKGEDLLERIDDIAVKEIRRQKLCWKYWAEPTDLKMEPISAGAAIGFRTLVGVDHEALAKFAISILWRAGASSMADMKNFVVPELISNRAREVTLGSKKFNKEFFPIKVFQYGTKGPWHNLTPMNHVLINPDGGEEPFFRLFANGLFFHIVDTSVAQPFDLGNASWYLGNQERLDVLCFDFHKSAQSEFATSVYSHYLSHRARS